IPGVDLYCPFSSPQLSLGNQFRVSIVWVNLDDHLIINQPGFFRRNAAKSFGGFNHSGFIQLDKDNLRGTSYATRIFNDDHEIPIIPLKHFLEFQRMAIVPQYPLAPEQKLVSNVARFVSLYIELPKAANRILLA